MSGDRRLQITIVESESSFFLQAMLSNSRGRKEAVWTESVMDC